MGKLLKDFLYILEYVHGSITENKVGYKSRLSGAPEKFTYVRRFIMKIAVINGPNLNLLGRREPEIYGSGTLEELQKMLIEASEGKNVEFKFFQSNSEGEIVDFIHQCIGSVDGIIINPGAYSHYSIAILDALRAFDGKIVEVHISNVFKREEIRHSLITARAADAVIAGMGFEGYVFAFFYLLSLSE